MEFEQLTINQEVDTGPVFQPLFPDYSFNTLDSDGKVYPLVDWATVMFSDCSVHDVLHWIQLGFVISDDLKQIYEVSVGYDNVFRISYQGIQIQVSKFYYYDVEFSYEMIDPFFDKVVPVIRLDISGSGLNYLRSIGVDFNEHRFVKPSLPSGGTYHFSRIDFAFDFINCFPSFVDDCLAFCNSNVLPSGRIPICNRGSGVSYRAAVGNQKTIYLGSSQSEKLLRIYDKRMEQMNLALGVYTKPNPYNNPDSWFRIEWQLRKASARDLAVKQISYEEILKMIFDQYAFADGTVKYSRDRKPVDFWQSLLPWDQIKLVSIQNAKYVQIKDPQQQLESWAERNIENIMTVVAEKGIDYLDRLAMQRCKDLACPENSLRLQRFISRFIGLRCSGLLPTDGSSPGLYVSMGRFWWSPISKFLDT